MRKNQAATPEATRLIKALDANYRYRHGEMLRWMLSDALKLTGLPVWESPPDEVRNQIDDAIHLYEEDVAKSEPFEDILGAPTWPWFHPGGNRRSASISRPSR